ncbi:citrate/2-methylcitrate synthase [Dactylosporangium sp. NPDC048998]|uniref:citrate/2-methylcitrate synthase n=1 Tax=Dactylosporangium sp. NPDC048998 TaxID=3363976 RepID=UPI0037207623
MSGWIGADEAARRLGVKAATLYSYVSRGVLTRRKAPDGHSVFDPAEIDRLARRGRPRRQPGGTELVIESAVTMLGEDRHYYRGRDAIGLADAWRLEQVAVWLWTGLEPPSEPSNESASEPSAEPAVESVTDLSAGPSAGASGAVARPAVRGARKRASGVPAAEVEAWAAGAEAVAAAREAQRGLASAVLPLERLQVIVTALAVADPVRLNLEPAAVARVGQGLVAGMVDALPARDGFGEPDTPYVVVGPGVLARDRTVHGRLWRKFAGDGADERLADALRFAMVLLADHELASSTLAARVAASVRADPYAVVLAGLGVTSGALHGGAALGVESLFGEIGAASRASYAMGERLRRGERIPGFGHAVYRAGDARGEALLERVRRAVPDHPRLAVAEAMLDEARRIRLPAMNVDFALGLLTHLAGMPRGAAEAIFGIARTVGWLAHAMEEYARPTRLRLRAAYTGPLD